MNVVFLVSGILDHPMANMDDVMGSFGGELLAQDLKRNEERHVTKVVPLCQYCDSKASVHHN